MKKNLILLLCFLSLHFAAQQESFDYLLLFESVREMPKKGSNKKENVQVAINTQDPSYYMYIYPDKTARLFDYKNLFVYHFNVNNKTEHLMSNLKMTKSVKMSPVETAYYSAKKINENEYLLQVFDQPEMKHSTRNITVKLKEAPADLLFIDADIGPNTIYLAAKLKEILDPEKTYMIERLGVDYKNGYIFKKSLIEYKKIEK